MERLKAQTVWFAENRIFVELSDGRIVGCPLNWFPRLEKASEQQRSQWELICGGTGLHWAGIDEDLSVEGFLTFRP